MSQLGYYVLSITFRNLGNLTPLTPLPSYTNDAYWLQLLNFCVNVRQFSLFAKNSHWRASLTVLELWKWIETKKKNRIAKTLSDMQATTTTKRLERSRKAWIIKFKRRFVHYCEASSWISVCFSSIIRDVFWSGGARCCWWPYCVKTSHECAGFELWGVRQRLDSARLKKRVSQKSYEWCVCPGQSSRYGALTVWLITRTRPGWRFHVCESQMP